MSNRIEKSRSKKTEQRDHLAATIESLGYEVMPCKLCSSKGWSCRMIEGVSRCSACVKRGRRCEGPGVPMNGLSRVLSEEKKLRAQEQEAQEALREAHRRANEAMARLERLRLQRESLVKRGAKMVNEGLSTLDIEDSSELNPLVAEESEAVSEIHDVGGFGAVDWGAIYEGADLSASAFLGFELTGNALGGTENGAGVTGNVGGS